MAGSEFAKQTFAMKVAEGCYMDNLGKFTDRPPPVPIYELGGGLVSLSPSAKDGLVKGDLSLMFSAKEPGHRNAMRSLGASEGQIALFEKIGDLASLASSVVSWGLAAKKVLEYLGILRGAKSIEEIASEILERVELLESMADEAQRHAVKSWLEDSMNSINAARDDLKVKSDHLKNLGQIPAADRIERRREMIDKINSTADPELRNILSDTRWTTFFLPKHYEWAWGRPVKDNFEASVLPVQLRHTKVLGSDGVTWQDVEWPARNQLWFDHRAALPFAVHGITSLLAMLTMAEPEFRSTMVGRPLLVAAADRLDVILENMRTKVLVRTVMPAYEFRWGVPHKSAVRLLTGAVVRKPLGFWKVGATDLRAGTDAFYLDIARSHPYPAPSKLGGLDWDWVPGPGVDIEWNSGRSETGIRANPYWDFTNTQAVADEANEQSDADYVKLLQTSGFMHLAQLQAMLRHLATDPTTSETVSGSIRATRQSIERVDLTVIGDTGGIEALSMCAPERLTDTASVSRYQVTTNVSLLLQPPDHANQIAVRLLLVALDGPADEPGWTVLSEYERAENVAHHSYGGFNGGTHLQSASTYDWYLRDPGNGTRTVLSLKKMRESLATSLQARAVEPVSEIPFNTFWDLTIPGRQRNIKAEGLDLRVTVTAADPASEGLASEQPHLERRRTVTIQTLPETRSFQNVYLVTEEALGSGERLRTYFDVSAIIEVFMVPQSFFDAEADCQRQRSKLIEEASKSARSRGMSVVVPTTSPRIDFALERLRAEQPEELERAISALRDNR